MSIIININNENLCSSLHTLTIIIFNYHHCAIFVSSFNRPLKHSNIYHKLLFSLQT